MSAFEMTEAELEATNDLVNYMAFALPHPRPPEPGDSRDEVLEKGLDLFMWRIIQSGFDPEAFPNAFSMEARIKSDDDPLRVLATALDLVKLVSSDRVVLGDDGGMFVSPRGINGVKWMNAILACDGSARTLLEEALKREVKYTKSNASLN